MKTLKTIFTLSIIFALFLTVSAIADDSSDRLKTKDLGHPYFVKEGTGENAGTELTLEEFDESSYNLYGKKGVLLAQIMHKGSLRADIATSISFKMWLPAENIDYSHEVPLTQPETLANINPGYRLADGTIFRRVTYADGTAGFAVE